MTVSQSGWLKIRRSLGDLYCFFGVSQGILTVILEPGRRADEPEWVATLRPEVPVKVRPGQIDLEFRGEHLKELDRVVSGVPVHRCSRPDAELV